MIAHIIRVIFTIIILIFIYKESSIAILAAFILIFVALEAFALWMRNVNKALRLIHQALENEPSVLKMAARKLATEADMFQCGEGDAMNLADAITELERLIK